MQNFENRIWCIYSQNIQFSHVFGAIHTRIRLFTLNISAWKIYTSPFPYFATSIVKLAQGARCDITLAINVKKKIAGDKNVVLEQF